MKILTILALAGSLAFAQSGKDWHANRAANSQRHVDALATMLDLTEAQKQQAATILSNADASTAALRPAVKTAEQNLQAAVKSNAVGQIDSLAAALASASAQEIAVRAKASAAFNALLTPAQQAKYETLHPTGSGIMAGRPHGMAR